MGTHSGKTVIHRTFQHTPWKRHKLYAGVGRRVVEGFCWLTRTTRQWLYRVVFELGRPPRIFSDFYWKQWRRRTFETEGKSLAVVVVGGLVHRNKTDNIIKQKTRRQIGLTMYYIIILHREKAKLVELLIFHASTHCGGGRRNGSRKKGSWTAPTATTTTGLKWSERP